MVGPGGKEWGMSPGSLLVPSVGVEVCMRGRAMLRVSGKRVVFSFTVVTLRILVILPPNFSEEIWAYKVEVASAGVFWSEMVAHFWWPGF